MLSSSLGAHAVRHGRVLYIGAGPDSWWGRLEASWVLAALAAFLPEVLERPLVALPPVGVARLDDMPGTAQQQLMGLAKDDERQERLARSLAAAYARAGACLNVAVPAEALALGEPVPLDRVWPRAIAALAEGVEAGAFENVCHGLLHLVPEALDEGRVDPLEFRDLGEGEAGRRLDVALDWHARALGRRAPTFVAPAWGYGEGSLAASAARRLPTWLQARAGPLLEGGIVRETLDPALEGLHRLDYRPLARLAALGLPPTLVLHGRSFDLRLGQLLRTRDAISLARLTRRRDIVRIPGVSGVRWLPASRFVELLRAHDRVEVEGADTRMAAEAGSLLLDSSGAAPARGRRSAAPWRRRRRVNTRRPATTSRARGRAGAR